MFTKPTKTNQSNDKKPPTPRNMKPSSIGQHIFNNEIYTAKQKYEQLKQRQEVY